MTIFSVSPGCAGVKNLSQTTPQTTSQTGGRIYSINLPRILKNLTNLALPIITLYALTNIEKANAGPLSYSACCIGCTAIAPPLMPACLAMCGVVLFLPSP